MPRVRSQIYGWNRCVSSSFYLRLCEEKSARYDRHRKSSRDDAARAEPLEKSGGLAVGLVWDVGAWDKRRVIPAELLRSLAGDGITLYSLQRGAGADRLAETGARDISTPDIVVLGHLLRRLDLVVCVDTMVAHLAGALGCEAWVLLHADCDWRWPASGAHTFWYPSLRLFHQKRLGQWDGVVEEVRQALLARAELKRAAA